MTDEIVDPDKVIDLKTRKPRRVFAGKAKGVGTKRAARTFVQKMGDELNKLPERDLTPEEAAFVAAVIDGCSFPEAYLQAYAEQLKAEVEARGADFSFETIQYRSWAVSRTPAVAQHIGQALDRESSYDKQNSQRIRNFVRKRLELEATTAKTPSARLKALELLGKTEGVDAFLERRKDTTEQAQDSQMEEIKELLGKLTG